MKVHELIAILKKAPQWSDVEIQIHDVDLTESKPHPVYSVTGSSPVAIHVIINADDYKELDGEGDPDGDHDDE